MTPKAFKEIRIALHLSQWQLAQTMTFWPETILRAETGAKPISRKMAQRLLDLAGIETCPTCGQSLPTQTQEG